MNAYASGVSVLLVAGWVFGDTFRINEEYLHLFNVPSRPKPKTLKAMKFPDILDSITRALSGLNTPPYEVEEDEEGLHNFDGSTSRAINILFDISDLADDISKNWSDEADEALAGVAEEYGGHVSWEDHNASITIDEE